MDELLFGTGGFVEGMTLLVRLCRKAQALIDLRFEQFCSEVAGQIAEGEKHSIYGYRFAKRMHLAPVPLGSYSGSDVRTRSAGTISRIGTVYRNCKVEGSENRRGTSRCSAVLLGSGGPVCFLRLFRSGCLPEQPVPPMFPDRLRRRRALSCAFDRIKRKVSGECGSPSRRQIRGRESVVVQVLGVKPCVLH